MFVKTLTTFLFDYLSDIFVVMNCAVIQDDNTSWTRPWSENWSLDQELESTNSECKLTNDLILEKCNEALLCHRTFKNIEGSDPIYSECR